MSLIPYKYWRELRVSTTSNSQISAAAPTFWRTAATHDSSDVYLRSVFQARMSYASDGTSTSYGWWDAAFVRLVISWDPDDFENPSDVGDDDSLTLGFVDLVPTYAKLVPTNAYMVSWAMPEGPLVLRTKRDGPNDGTLPGVIASLFYGDQNGFWSGAAEVSGIRRAQVTGRVLWGSAFP